MASRSARTDLPATIEVARVLRPHGIRGEIRLAVLSDVADRFRIGARMQFVRGSERRVLTIRSFRDQGDSALVAFEESRTRDDAEALKGGVLEVDRSEVPPAPDGVWYTFELVGCRCRDADAGELGKIVDVIEDGGGWILQIDDGKRVLLVPLVQGFLDRVDVEAAEIELRLPEGLIETCASVS